MPRVPSISPATGRPTTSSYIHTTESAFVDNVGRTLLLRGVNLSGSSKAPVGKPSFILEDFWETAENGGDSFVGRPLCLEDGSADVHLTRLRGWGFNMLRFAVTWESLEHAGPGKYDYEYMDYVVQVLRKCKDYGFKVYMNPHQDIWSRFSGGSGAPYWSLIACGLNPRNFTATQAAMLHCEYPEPEKPNPAEFPAMQWSTNYGRLASQTLYTLFFGGNTFAPKAIIDEQNIQDWLQGHFIRAFGELADLIRDAGDLFEECVIGWDSMNEPNEGFCGYEDLNAVPEEQGSTFKRGSFPTPAQSLKLGMGQAQTVANWDFGRTGPKKAGTVTIDPKGKKMWADPSTEPHGVHPRWGWRRSAEWQLGTCLWAQHGIWDIESGFMLRPDYFSFPPEADEDHLEFMQDFFRPHWAAYAKRIRQSHPEGIMFVQPPVFALPPQLEEEDLKGRCCYSTHYYDGFTLITRHWNWFNADALGLIRGKYKNILQAVRVGESAIRKSIQEQLGVLKQDAPIISSGKAVYPTIVGEIGTPFDMDGKRSYGWTDNGKHLGDYSNQQKALDASLNAADGPNALNWTVWTYCPDNSHDWGDGWNMEDLSIWSPDDTRPTGKDVMNASGTVGTESTYGIGDESSAALIKSTKLGSSVTAATIAIPPTKSTISLSTLPLASTAPSDETQKLDLFSASWGNPYDFLTDGARAVKAFCRPFPTAVIGVPKDIQFNIGKAEFKLTVNVGPEDALRTQDDHSSLSSAGGLDKEVELATEIYVPLVHFAHDKYVAKYQDQSVSGNESDTDIQDPKFAREIISDTPGGSRNVSTINLLTLLPQHASAVDLVPPAVLDVSVHVSGGRWEVDGQTLKWWYPIPKDGEGDKEYTIEIRRNKGIIKSTTEDNQCQEWFETLCPMMSDVCVIM